MSICSLYQSYEVCRCENKWESCGNVESQWTPNPMPILPSEVEGVEIGLVVPAEVVGCSSISILA